MQTHNYSCLSVTIIENPNNQTPLESKHSATVGSKAIPFNRKKPQYLQLSKVWGGVAFSCCKVLIGRNIAQHQHFSLLSMDTTKNIESNMSFQHSEK